MISRDKPPMCGYRVLLGLLLSMAIPASVHAAATSVPGSAASRMEQSPPSAALPGDIMLTQARLDEAVRLLAEVGKTNIVITGKIAENQVSLYLHNTSVEDMVRNLCRAAGVWYRYDKSSQTYLIMSGEEYQKDLTIVRDEQTRIFTLRHQNVVSTANAIRALFGSRVLLSKPVEEMPPQSLGAGARTNATTNNSSSASNAARSSTASGSTGTGFASNNNTDQVSVTERGGLSGGANSSYDPTSDLSQMSLERINNQTRADASGRPVAALTDIQNMAARQSPPVYVTYNKLNNLLIIRTGDEEAIKQIEQLVHDMDKPPRQVLLEMQILEVTLDSGFTSVFEISQASGTADSRAPLLSGSASTARTAMISGNFGVEDGATFSWQIMNKNLSARLQLMAADSKLKVLSSPMLVAANNQPARLFIGDERVLIVGASSESKTGTTGASNTTITVETEKRDVGHTLSILPRINSDRSVSLTVDQDSSSVKIGDTTLPISTADGDIINYPIDTVSTATLQVTAHTRDGMTVAIGGMIRETTQFDEQKVPVLGDVPVLGLFFKRDTRARVRSQIVLLITPRVMDTPEEGDLLARDKKQHYESLTDTFPNKPVVPKTLNYKYDVPETAY